jgi:magnesium transporter
MDALVERKKPVPAPSSSEPGVVAASVYSAGRRTADIAIDDAGEWSKKPEHVVWIGLFEPSHELLARLQAQLGLHDLAIEDAGKAHQHPKIEQYGDSLFIVARTAQIVDGKIAFGETHPPVRRPRLCRLSTARRIGVLQRSARAM